MNGSPVCTRQWSFIWCRNLNALPQNSHLNGRSPVCTGKCAINDVTSGKLLPQNLHKTTLPWSLFDAPEPAVELLPPPPPLAACMAAAAAAAAAAKSKFSSPPSPDGSSESNSADDRCVKCGSCGKLDNCNARLSRYFNESSECDNMCRVSLLWCGKLAPQYIQDKTWCDSCPTDASCNQTKIHTSTSFLCFFFDEFFLGGKFFPVIQFCCCWFTSLLVRFGNFLFVVFWSILRKMFRISKIAFFVILWSEFDFCAHFWRFVRISRKIILIK